MRFFLYSLAFFASFVTAARAELSVSEQAAQTQRPATAEERRLHQTGCAFKPTANLGRIKVGSGLSFKQVETPSLQTLILFQVKRQPSSDKYAIAKFDPLPNGGIAGKDFCEAVHLTTPQPGPAVVRQMALRLRSNMDVLALYPSTAKTAQKRGMLLEIPAGHYIKVKAKGNRHTQWLENQAETWDGRDYSRPGFNIGDTHYIPVRPQR